MVIAVEKAAADFRLRNQAPASTYISPEILAGQTGATSLMASVNIFP